MASKKWIDRDVSEIVKLLNWHFPNVKATKKWLHSIVGDGYLHYKKQDGKIAAYAVVSIEDSLCTLQYIGVRKEYRRDGYGSELLEDVINKCREDGYWFETYVSVHNIPSLNMCIKAGLSISRITKSWVFFKLD